jgi:CRISPR type III-B/RAMP module RAMP protein Cmr1
MNHSQIKFKLHSETALFMGSSREGESELRASAIKGTARYWLRTLVSHRFDSAGLRALDGWVFGDRRTHGPSFVIAQTGGERRSQKTRSLTPHKNIKGENPPSLGAGQDYELKIGIPADDSGLRLQLVAAALWAAFSLGGFGMRKRRGAGSYTIISAEAEDFASNPQTLEISFTSEDSSAEQIRKSLNNIEAIVERAANATKTQPATEMQIPSLFRDGAVATFELAAGDETAFRKNLMEALRPFKSSAFGLPLQMDGHFLKGPGLPRRHASPLWLSGRPQTPAELPWRGIATVVPPFPPGDASKVKEFLLSLPALEWVRGEQNIESWKSAPLPDPAGQKRAAEQKETVAIEGVSA